MKKSRIISVVLTLALVLTTVFAGTEGVFANSTMNMKSTPSATAKALTKSAVMSAAADDSITAKSLNASGNAAKYEATYSNGSVFAAKVNIPKAGTFKINLHSASDITAMALYDSLESDGKQLGYGETYATQETKALYVKVKKAGTYYLAFGTTSYSPVSAVFSVEYAPSGNVTPTKGKTYYSSATSSSYTYYKIVAPSTGYITISFPTGSAGDNSVYNIKLMNYKKSKNLLKYVNKVNYAKSFTTYTAVAKGTYYVAVKSSTDSCYGINLKFTKVSENSGATRAKAKSIFKGGTKRGTILATQTSSNADWYKIKVNSSQLVSLAFSTYTGGSSGGFRLSVYSGNKAKAFGSADFYYGDPEDILSLTTRINGVDTGRLQKGTYYIKVQKYGSASGFYKLQWK